MAAYRINNKCTQKGYTLIELLLVVTVLAFIAAMGVKTYRDKAIADRANIAALNIQHVLEAGISYNIAENGLWPKKNWSNSTCTTTPDDDIFVKNYLPNNSNQSNLGVPLCWSGDDPTLGEQKAKRFWVALSVGSSSDSTIVALAQRIAARLPNAIITNNPDEAPLTATPTNTCTSGSCFVKAEVAIPSGGGIAGNSLVVGVGYCDSDVPASGRVYGTQPGSGTNISCRRTKISEQFPGVGFANPSADSLSQYEIDFQCRPGEFPKVYVTPNFVRMDRWQGQKLGDPADTRAEPLYQLSGAPESSVYAPPPEYYNKYYKDYGLYCGDGPTVDGAVKCLVTMVASFGAQSNGPITQIGCTTEYQNLGLCNCATPGQSGSGGCASRPGAIGASYVAVCNPATSQSFANNQNNKSYW